jgi:hypothetical protein
VLSTQHNYARSTFTDACQNTHPLLVCYLHCTNQGLVAELLDAAEGNPYVDAIGSLDAVTSLCCAAFGELPC